MDKPGEPSHPPGLLARLLARETSGRPFVPQIDGLRFFAIVSVLAFHFAPEYRDALRARHDPSAAAVGGSWVYQLTDAGQVGVSLFFVISGLVLALPFARQHLTGGRRVDLRSYFVRRVTRIEPPYVICLCALFLIQSVQAHWHHAGDHLKHLGFSLLYLHNAWFHGGSTINGVAWSLEVEVQFYVLAPLLALVFLVRPAWLRRAVIGITMVATATLRLHLRDPYHGLTLAHQLHYFLAGFLLADLYLLDWQRPAHARWAWDVAAVVGWAALLWVMLETRNAVQPFILPWLMLVIDAAAFRGRWWPWLVSRPFVYVIGGMCYTIYLYHVAIARPLMGWAAGVHLGSNPSLDCAAQVALGLTAAIAGSAVLFVFLEKPFMRRDWTTRVLRFVTGRRADVPIDPAAPVPGMSTSVR
jgi:peptidoglycan/LPS O-acetylase OafA/YrhL